MSPPPFVDAAAVPSLEPDAGPYPHVFVYGTLRQGERNDIAQAARSLGLAPPPCLGTCWVHGELVDLGTYPGLVWASADNPAGHAVLGEVYAINSRLEAKLDEIESVYPAGQGGSGNEYAKHRVHTPWGDALVYVLAPEVARGKVRLRGGDWVAYRRAIAPDAGSNLG